MSEDYKRILVAIDGSEEARGAFEKAVTIAKRNDSELLVVHVIGNDKDYQIFDPVTAKNDSKRAEKTLDEYVDYAKDQGVEKVRKLLRKGSPKKVITEDIPTEEQIDIIITGATGKGTIEQAHFGSVSSDLVFYAPTDVLVTRENTK